MTNTNEFIKKLIASFLQKENNFLTSSLKRALSISNFRQNQHKNTAPYGFEWAIQTSLSYFLSKNSQISELKICKKTCCVDNLNKYKKYDFCFFLFQQNCKVIIELKTVDLGWSSAKSYIKNDINKSFPPDTVAYVFVSSYPTSNSDFPIFQNANKIITDKMPENFRYCVYKIKG
jgi:hypothetical protein